MFFKLFDGCHFDSKFLNEYGLESFVEVPFTNENKDIQLPQNLESSLIEVLKSVKKQGGKPEN
jgi:hypothetical protein